MEVPLFLAKIFALLVGTFALLAGTIAPSTESYRLLAGICTLLAPSFGL
jgi:hypothetical protein